MECKFCKKAFENWSSLIQHEDECETPIERDSKPQSKFERLYKNKLRDCRRISRESQKKIKFLNDQLKELKLEFNNPKFNAFSNSVVNSETINDYFRICELVSEGHANTAVRKKKLLTSFQKLIVGVNYGAVPLSVPQRLQLSSEDREFIAKVEKLPLPKLQQLVLKEQNVFVKVIDVLRESIRFLKNVQS